MILRRALSLLFVLTICSGLQAQDFLSLFDGSGASVAVNPSGENGTERSPADPEPPPGGRVTTQSQPERLSNGKLILGEMEVIRLEPFNTFLTARMDTGAAASSLHAAGIEYFKQNGEDWVRFNLNHDGGDRPMEAKVEESILIRQAGNASLIRRPVVKLSFMLGEDLYLADFSLADRRHMTFPVLLGRNFLKGRALVDVSRSYLQGGAESGGYPKR